MDIDIWVSSDWHLGHKNMIPSISEWKDKIACRNFNSLKEHDDTIINTINKYIKEDDILYLIGDFSMGGRENVYKYRKRINCKNIHFILGNHDLHIRKNSMFEDGTKAQSLFASIQDILMKKIDKIDYTMCHYAFRTWNKASQGSVMLHAHSHGTLPNYEKLIQIADDICLYKTGDLYKEFDVGIDVAYELTGEWRPFNIKEINNIMKNRINLDVDRH